ncbi:hypothetical protein ACIBG8_47640 [Nonomuraea sp. NPDC050556]|uniref:hypothetical protein n=1 Tax=Nonomuraea sp. NPDC050556 TaxID=3364369 RepID=UPI0037AD3177
MQGQDASGQDMGGQDVSGQDMGGFEEGGGEQELEGPPEGFPSDLGASDVSEQPAADPAVGATPSPSAGLAEAGQVQGLWNDPQLRLPQAAPSTATPSPSAQPMGAPLPRQLAIANRKSVRDEPLNMLTGVRGLPLAGMGIAVLLAALWGVVKAQRVRIQRRSQAVP